MSSTGHYISLDEIAEDQPFGTPKQRIIASVARTGRVRHVLVRRRAVGKYDVVAGHQWVAAARIAGLQTVDVIFEEDLDAREPLERQRIISSLQCDGIDHLFIGRCLAALLQKGGVTQVALSEEFDISETHISNILRVLECPDLVAIIEKEQLAFGAAKVLAGLMEKEREPLLFRLRNHKMAHDRFPTIAQITEMVAKPRGEVDVLALPSGCTRELVTGLEARDRRIEIRYRNKRRKEIVLVLSVEREDRAWIQELAGRAA
jgi:ParB/RepB/Spo0J family partition protein